MMLGMSRDYLRVLLVMILPHAFLECAFGADYPVNLALAQIPMFNNRAPRLDSFCTEISPKLVPFCSHVTYPVFAKRLMSDSEWQVSKNMSIAAHFSYLFESDRALLTTLQCVLLNETFFAATRRQGCSRPCQACLLRQGRLQATYLRKCISGVQYSWVGTGARVCLAMPCVLWLVRPRQQPHYLRADAPCNSCSESVLYRQLLRLRDRKCERIRLRKHFDSRSFMHAQRA
jgi:hypothetical protein